MNIQGFHAVFVSALTFGLNPSAHDPWMKDVPFTRRTGGIFVETRCPDLDGIDRTILDGFMTRAQSFASFCASRLDSRILPVQVCSGLKKPRIILIVPEGCMEIVIEIWNSVKTFSFRQIGYP